MSLPAISNRARDFSLEFLKILEDCLEIVDTGTANPQFVPAKISRLSIERLARSLRELECSDFADSAIRSMEVYGRSGCIQTMGVGFARDFDFFVKLGLLVGQRVVLWDAAIMGQLMGNEIDIVQLGRTACELMRWKRVVENGGTVILPHPYYAGWNDRCVYYLERLGNISRIDPTFVGFVNATALLDEGFMLHPYAFSENWEELRAAHGATVVNHDLFRIEKLDHHQRLAQLVADPRFVYLRNVSPASFFAAIAASRQPTQSISIALHHAMNLPSSGLSQPERKRACEEVIAMIDAQVTIQNEGLVKNGSTAGTVGQISFAGATIGVVGSALKFVADPSGWSTMLSFAASLCGLPRAAAGLIQPSKSNSHRDIIVQTFTQMKSDAEREQIDALKSRWLNPAGNSA